jgi:UDP-N-acetylglucosamine--N-acetylmuramyl-(pentapeptide) pyrophosphoryl-undecaprenol N-acetylglucosamine transferase
MQARENYRFILSGGGTGGHIFPAVAIADALKGKYKAEILFIGAEGRMEMDRVPEAGYPIIGLRMAGLQRKLDWKNLKLPFLLMIAVWKAVKTIREFKPHAVVGVGGYVSAPVMIAGVFTGVPVFIQEQNAFAGLTNKALGRFARRIYVAFDGMSRFFPASKLSLKGNPIRKELMKPLADRVQSLAHFGFAVDKPTLLVIGGSLGAPAINRAMGDAITGLSKTGIQVIWQTGKGGIDLATQKTLELSGVVVRAFIKEMPQAYAAADVVVSRAGALACSEICAQQKAALLIPSPFVAEDHQTVNARNLEKHGAAVVLAESHISKSFEKEVHRLLTEPELRQKLALAAARLALPDAAVSIADDMIQTLQGNEQAHP